jgi:hypothetical protein
MSKEELIEILEIAIQSICAKGCDQIHPAEEKAAMFTYSRLIEVLKTNAPL